MLLNSFARRAVAAAAAAGLLAAALAPASAATAPGWTVSKTLGPDQGVWANALVPDSAKDAWATWQALGQFDVEHWTGSSWSQVPVPASDLKAAKAAVSLGASSASNVWLFDHGLVLRWNGSQWNRQAIPPWVVAFSRAGNFFGTSEVLSPTDVWVFSAHIGHYNGHTWTKVIIPGLPSTGFCDTQTAIAPSDMWVLCQTSALATPGYVIEHWNGTSWNSMPVPAVTPPTGASEFIARMAAAGPSDIWLQRYITTSLGKTHTLYLMHWNGTSWSHVKLGIPTSTVDFMAADGNGGVWLAANGPLPAATPSFDHFTAGKWSQAGVPASAGMKVLDVTGFAWVPGSQSLWATGNQVAAGNHIFGTTWSFTP